MKVAVTLSSWRLCFYREYSTYWKPDQIPGSCSVWRSVSLRRRSRGWSLLWVRTCPLQKRWHLHQGTYSFSEINGYIYSMNISLSCRPFHYYYISQRLIGHEIFKLFFFFFRNFFAEKEQQCSGGMAAPEGASKRRRQQRIRYISGISGQSAVFKE